MPSLGSGNATLPCDAANQIEGSSRSDVLQIIDSNKIEQGVAKTRKKEDTLFKILQE